MMAMKEEENWREKDRRQWRTTKERKGTTTTSTTIASRQKRQIKVMRTKEKETRGAF